MHPFFQNKYVRFVGAVLLTVIVILFLLTLFLSGNFSNSRGVTSIEPSYYDDLDYQMEEMSMNKVMVDGDYAYSAPSMINPRPTPYPDGYTSHLEAYETTTYNLSAKTKRFTELCDTISILKSDPQIHFKTINTATNNCSARFYVEENAVENVLNTLTKNKDVRVIRNTESVTRHRQNLQSQTDIVKQQLDNVERSLNMAETEFDKITAFAQAQNNAKSFADSITQKLQLIDSLTSRKINLVNQLNQLYQQSADLEERLNVVEFYTNITRSYPIEQTNWSQRWESAWQDLQKGFNQTMIDLTINFAGFLLKALQIFIYLLVAIVFIRGLWKFGRTVWRRW